MNNFKKITYFSPKYVKIGRRTKIKQFLTTKIVAQLSLSIVPMC